MYWNLISIFFLTAVAFSLKPTTPRICKNCKYFIPDVSYDGSIEFSKCSVFNTTTTLSNTKYLVTGVDDGVRVHVDYRYCTTARSNADMCGKEGQLYKRKYVKRS
jgi:hypothetical protein